MVVSFHCRHTAPYINPPPRGKCVTWFGPQQMLVLFSAFGNIIKRTISLIQSSFEHGGLDTEELSPSYDLKSYNRISKIWLRFSSQSSKNKKKTKGKENMHLCLKAPHVRSDPAVGPGVKVQTSVPSTHLIQHHELLFLLNRTSPGRLSRQQREHIVSHYLRHRNSMYVCVRCSTQAEEASHDPPWREKRLRT